MNGTAYTVQPFAPFAPVDLGDGVVLRSLERADADWVVERHVRRYTADERFDATFGPVVREAIDRFLRERRPDTDFGGIVERDGHRVGSVLCSRDDAYTARFRLFFLEPAERGRGFGRAVLHACLAHASRAGFTQMTVRTYLQHEAACALYRSCGFVASDQRAVTAFGRHLAEVRFDRALQGDRSVSDEADAPATD